MASLSTTRVTLPYDAARDMPFRIWRHSHGRGWGDVALYGVDSEPFTVSANVPTYTVVAYVEGKSRLSRRFDGRELVDEVHPGDLALKSLESHGEWSWDRPNSTIQVYLQPRLLQGLVTEIYGPRTGAWRLRDCTRVRDDELLRLVHALAAEAASDEPGSAIMAGTLAQQLALRLIRRHIDLIPETAQRRQVFDGAQRRQIVEFIASNLDLPNPLTALSRAENLSNDCFSRIFRNTFDCSPQEHLRHARLQRARALLETTPLTLAEIACESGFADQSHLTRLFKGRFGEPPGAWRSRRRDMAQCIPEAEH